MTPVRAEAERNIRIATEDKRVLREGRTRNFYENNILEFALRLEKRRRD